MSVLAAIAAFPVLTLLLIGLSKAENGLQADESAAARRVVADPPPVSQ